MLATLHLPPDWYPPAALRPARPRTWLNCVSAAPAAACPPSPNLVEPIENGVPVERLRARHAKRGFALFLGRICPEKGVHLALRAAHRAGVSLIVAGELYSYPAHRDYFEGEVRPLLDARRRFVGPVGFARKRRLLTAARCLLVPSLAAETSSLVVREAAACGTPVVAFPSGAIAEAVEEGRTGFLVPDVDAMAEAIGRTGAIDPAACRALARERFDEAAMAERYLALYARLARPRGQRRDGAAPRRDRRRGRTALRPRAGLVGPVRPLPGRDALPFAGLAAALVARLRARTAPHRRGLAGRRRSWPWRRSTSRRRAGACCRSASACPTTSTSSSPRTPAPTSAPPSWGR